MPASFGQLQALVALAQERSFSKAARLLRVTQPAVTQHLANLSREVGVQLVDVVNRRPVLTDAGAYLTERARTIVDAIAALDADMAEFKHGRSGVLRIGATLTIGTYLIPDLLAKFWKQRPRIRADVRIANTSAVAQSLRSHELGLALVEGIITDDAIVTAPFLDDELMLITGVANGPFAERPRVRAAELAPIPFVSREPGSGTRDLGYEALSRMGVRPPVILELPSSEAILRAVETGAGAAILSRFAVEREVRAGTVRTISIADLPLHRRLFIAAARGRTLSPLQRSFARVVLGNDEGTAAFEAALSQRRSTDA
ncbi:MAG TPA: LysR family transcriptional regulator [Candidatus Baltobacteraceae bacterium]|nr:LysR family transcriptional regulator [Candidatus Baltobacteraceae bacterium]